MLFVSFFVAARDMRAGMVELADTQVLGTCTERCAGSSPAPGIHSSSQYGLLWLFETNNRLLISDYWLPTID